MDEAAAGEVMLLRAIETSGHPRWTAAEAAAATRSALQAVGAGAPAEAFLQARAQAGLHRLQAAEPALARWRGARPWRHEALWIVAVLALLAGLLIDRIGAAQRIDLLAPPVWAVVAWNLAVGLVWLARRVSAPDARGWVARALAQLARRWRSRRFARGGGAAVAWPAFTADWAALTQPLQAARIALLLHVGAAALALGLIAGLYLRGLVLDYAVGWQSTFLDAATVQALLAKLLAPAAALSGFSLPDVAGIADLRIGLGTAPAAAAGAAAPWIHLYALTLALFVVLPRLVLAATAALRERRARDLALPLHEPYFRRLLRHQHGGATPLEVHTHGRAPDAAAREALASLLAAAYGEAAAVRFMPVVAYGDEDDAPAAAEGSRALALFDLTATPEAESQGRLLQRLARPGGAPLAIVDEAAFVQRFGAASPRRTERRSAWHALVDSVGGQVVFVDLRAPDAAAFAAAVDAAA